MKGFNKGDVNKVLLVEEQGRTCCNVLKLDKLRLHKDIIKDWYVN